MAKRSGKSMGKGVRASVWMFVVGGLGGPNGMGVYGLMCDRYIRRVGFEPTRSKTPELEAGPLDLSGNGVVCEALVRAHTPGRVVCVRGRRHTQIHTHPHINTHTSELTERHAQLRTDLARCEHRGG